MSRSFQPCARENPDEPHFHLQAAETISPKPKILTPNDSFKVLGASPKGPNPTKLPLLRGTLTFGIKSITQVFRVTMQVATLVVFEGFFNCISLFN